MICLSKSLGNFLQCSKNIYSVLSCLERFWVDRAKLTRRIQVNYCPLSVKSSGCAHEVSRQIRTHNVRIKTAEIPGSRSLLSEPH